MSAPSEDMDLVLIRDSLSFSIHLVTDAQRSPRTVSPARRWGVALRLLGRTWAIVGTRSRYRISAAPTLAMNRGKKTRAGFGREMMSGEQAPGMIDRPMRPSIAEGYAASAWAGLEGPEPVGSGSVRNFSNCSANHSALRTPLRRGVQVITVLPGEIGRPHSGHWAQAMPYRI